MQILRLPWLSEMTLKIGNYSALARAFRTSTRRDAFSPETLETYREAWRQPGAVTGMLNWYRALLRRRAADAGAGQPDPADARPLGRQGRVRRSAARRRQRGLVQERPPPAPAAGDATGSSTTRRTSSATRCSTICSSCVGARRRFIALVVTASRANSAWLAVGKPRCRGGGASLKHSLLIPCSLSARPK